MATTNKGWPTKEKPLICSFCGKSQDEVDRMIICPGFNICNECIELCYSLLGNDDDRFFEAPNKGWAPNNGKPPMSQYVNLLTT